jgi:hypothetical protein
MEKSLGMKRLIKRTYRFNPNSKKITLMRALASLSSYDFIEVSGNNNLRYLRNIASRYKIYITVTNIGFESYRVSLKTDKACDFVSVAGNKVKSDYFTINNEGLFNLKQDLLQLGDEELGSSIDLISTHTSNEETEKYSMLERKWETKTQTHGKSGYVIDGYSYYIGHKDIPEDWIVYHSEFNCLFKPKYVKNPVLLSNKTPRSIGVPDTVKFVGGVTPEEAERRFQFLSTYGQEKK